MTQKLLLAFSDVDIVVRYAEDHFGLIRTCLQVSKKTNVSIFQILRSQPWPNFHRFRFRVNGKREVYPRYTELKNKFPEYHLTVGRPIAVGMPQHFFATASCHIAIHRRYTSLYCGYN